MTLDTGKAGLAMNWAVKEEHENTRTVLETMTVPELAALRQGIANLQNEVACLVETVTLEVEAPER